jgi:hypothetical protein
MEQYKTENVKLEKDLPMLREVAGGTWKKEDELKQLKSEVAALDRKIQLTFTPTQTQNEQANSTNENTSKINSDRVFIAKPNVNDKIKIVKGMRL